LVAQAFQPAQVFGAAWKGCATDKKLVGNDQPQGGEKIEMKEFIIKAES